MESGGRNNFGRRRGGAFGGRSGGVYQGQGGGRRRGGSARAQGNQYHYQGRGQQQWAYRPPLQAYQDGGGSGGSPQPWGSGPVQPDPSQGSGAGVQSPAQQQVGVGSASPSGAWTGRPSGPSSPPPAQPRPSTCTKAWTGRPCSPATSSSSPAPAQPTDAPDIQSLKISENPPMLSQSQGAENRIMCVKRPDLGGSLAIRTLPLLVNHFKVNYNPNATIIHYDVDVKLLTSSGDGVVKKSVPKSVLRQIREQLFSDDSRFPKLMSAYDGEKNIFSAVPLPTGEFRVQLSQEEDSRNRTYLFTIKVVNELKLSKLKDYLKGNLSHIPYDILQGMDVVMRDNPSKQRISVGRSYYSSTYRAEDDLHNGVAGYRGFQPSLRPTSQGLVLCLDYSVLAFRKPMSVLEFLKEHVSGFRGANDVIRMRQEVTGALKGLKVRVTHRVTKQKYTVAGLTMRTARDISFTFKDPDRASPPREINYVDYFWDKWGKTIMHPDIPRLDVSKNNRHNFVPMEFCQLVEGQRYPKEKLEREAAMFLKKLSLDSPNERKETINRMVRATDGLCGPVLQNFDIGIDKNMTRIEGRVIDAPDLKLGSPSFVKVDRDKCEWNLVGKSLLEGKSIESWALIDFTKGSGRFKALDMESFVGTLRGRCQNLRMSMNDPLVCRFTSMKELFNINSVKGLLESVVQEATRRSSKLQLIVCAMTEKHPGYKYLKWVSETEIGVITQCFLSTIANKLRDQYFANLCIKINAKLGGSNFELSGKLPHFNGNEHVMFIGADVNHPAVTCFSSPSIAAVVGTVNWPAANRYAARICPQENRREKILKFGTMCSDLVNAFAQINGVKPSRIVVFRVGVSEGQFDMVLNEELFDLMRAIYNDNYKPKITLVVAQKRHSMRLFPEKRGDAGASGNVPPGTVVDKSIVHPFEFDFYLCSHYSGIGTSKPTHYYVLWDENHFTSDSMQKLIHHMCFTFARCTKPVSLVPPVFYAGLVAYRGRLFQKVEMELNSRGSFSSATVSYNQSFYSLHPELKDGMFFV